VIDQYAAEMTKLYGEYDNWLKPIQIFIDSHQEWHEKNPNKLKNGFKPELVQIRNDLRDFYFSHKQYKELKSVGLSDSRVNGSLFTEQTPHGQKPHRDYGDYVFVKTDFVCKITHGLSMEFC
jgi:hypothetical protein